MKIAIVGAEDSVEKIYKILSKNNQDVELVLKKEDKIENTTRYICENKDKVDGFYLTGIGVYHALLRDEKEKIDTPVVFSKRSILGILKSFLEIKELKTKKIGFDVVEEKVFLDLCEEFNLNIQSYYHQEYNFEKTEKEYLKKYIELYKTKEVNCILTSFGYIYRELKKKKIPVYRIESTNLEIEEDFRELLYRIKLKKAQQNMISTVIFKINSNYTVNKLFEKRGIIEKMLLEYSKDVKGSVQGVAADEYIIISNSELVKKDFNLHLIHKLLELLKKNGIDIYVGIGEGDTVFNAEKNARNALRFCKKENENTIFICGDNYIKGPLFNEHEYVFEKNEKIEEIKNKTNINTDILQKISLNQKNDENTYFSSLELSKLLNLTERSVNRIIKKLIELELVESKKEDIKVGVGRPRRVFKFKF